MWSAGTASGGLIAGSRWLVANWLDRCRSECWFRFRRAHEFGRGLMMQMAVQVAPAVAVPELLGVGHTMGSAPGGSEL
jgi:hypothetical protein